MSLLETWLAVWISTYALSTSITVLRLYLRWRLKRLAKSDALTAFCLIVSTNLFAIAVATGSIGLRASGPRMDQLGRLTVQAFFYYISAMVVVPLSKVCVTLLLLEVEVNEAWRRFLKIVQFFILLTALVNITLCFFGCYTPGGPGFWGILTRNLTPAAASQTHQKNCVVREQLIPINGALNVLYECLIFAAAISLVFRVRTSRLQKAGLTLSFAFAFVTMAASIMNLYINLTVYLRERRSLPVGAIYIYRAGLAIAVEAYAGLIVASILPIRSTLLQFFSSLLTPLKKPKTFSEDSYATSSMSQVREVDASKDLKVETHAHAEQYVVGGSW